jgi:hypothetical protein
MKTEKIMNRKLDGFDVNQRISDAMFNATSLLTQWNSIKENPQRDLSKFWELDNVKAFIEIMMQEEKLNTPTEGYLKTRGKNGGTWMHPILFTKFAMWLNPRFEYFVIKFVNDELINFRHSAGDNFKCLTSSLNMFNNVNYPQVAKGLNYIVFGKHEEDLRQNASIEQLKELSLVQQKLSFAIDMGYIKSFDELLNEMRRMYFHKHSIRFK